MGGGAGKGMGEVIHLFQTVRVCMGGGGGVRREGTGKVIHRTLRTSQKPLGQPKSNFI